MWEWCNMWEWSIMPMGMSHMFTMHSGGMDTGGGGTQFEKGWLRMMGMMPMSMGVKGHSNSNSGRRPGGPIPVGVCQQDEGAEREQRGR